jgi:hypothetical protein
MPLQTPRSVHVCLSDSLSLSDLPLLVWQAIYLPVFLATDARTGNPFRSIRPSHRRAYRSAMLGAQEIYIPYHIVATTSREEHTSTGCSCTCTSSPA